DCKKALVETEGDVDKATDFLKKKGLAAAAKKAGRIATEGLVQSYIHGNARVGGLGGGNCETDFVARGEAFRDFVKEITMQIAAMSPQYVSVDEMPADVIAREREILVAKAKESGKPDNIVARMVDGQIAKWQKEQCLLEQPWVKDDKKTIKDLLQELVS